VNEECKKDRTQLVENTGMRIYSVLHSHPLTFLQVFSNIAGSTVSF